MKVKEESEKVGLKLNIQKTKIMTSSPISSWQIDGETVETVEDFILGACKSLQMVTTAMKLKYTCSLQENLWPSYVYPAMLCLVSQSCLTLCDPMDCSPPDFSVHGDSPGKNTGVGCYASSRGSSQSRDQTQVSHSASRSLPSEPPGKPMSILDSILKSRNISLPAKVRLVKAMVFP